MLCGSGHNLAAKMCNKQRDMPFDSHRFKKAQEGLSWLDKKLLSRHYSKEKKNYGVLS